MAEPNFHGHLIDRKPSPAQQCHSALQPAPDHVLMHRNADRPAKVHGELRYTQPRDPGDLSQTELTTQVVFDEGRGVAQSPSAHRAAFRRSLASDGAVIVHETGGKSLGQALQIQRPAWIAALHLRLERPANVLEACITDLKAAADFEMARVGVRTLHDAAQQLLLDRDHQIDVGASKLPGRRKMRGDDVDVAENHCSPVLRTSVAREGVDRRTGM